MPFDTDRFDAYVRDELSAQDRARLEAELSADRAAGGDLSREWDAHAAAADAVLLDAVRRRVSAAGSRYQARQPAVAQTSAPSTSTARVRPLWQRSWAAAAALLLLVAAGGYFLLSDPPPDQSPAELASTYFEPAIGLPTLLGPAEDIRFEDGMVDYKQGMFAVAAAKWRPLIGEDFNQDTLSYYLGVAEIAAGQPAAGLEQLGRVASPELQEARQWYEAVGLLMLGRKDEANTLLESVRIGGGRWADEATELLSEL